MESLPDRTCRVLRSQPGLVVPLPVVIRLLRADGCAVTEWVLLRALRGDPRFRLLQPLRGPLAPLHGSATGSATGPDPSAARHAPTHTLVVLRGVERLAEAPRPLGGGLARRVGRSVATLAHALEEDSPMGRIRWLRMLTEVPPAPS